jgi:methionyl-tRNA synthetase
MIFKNLDGGLPDAGAASIDHELEDLVRSHIGSMRVGFDQLAFSDGLDTWIRAVFACNQYVDEQAPWALRKTDPDRMAAVLMTLFRCIRDLAIAVRPVVPASADKLLDQMGIAPDQRRFAALENDGWFADLVVSGFRVAQPVGVFPRLEMPAEDVA